MTWDGKPALTEEWGKQRDTYPYMDEGGVLHLNCTDPFYNITLTAQERHTLAALCLKDQEFGFTRHQAEALMAIAKMFKEHNDEHLSGYLDDIATRIAALLPPEPKC